MRNVLRRVRGTGALRSGCHLESPRDGCAEARPVNDITMLALKRVAMIGIHPSAILAFTSLRTSVAGRPARAENRMVPRLVSYPARSDLSVATVSPLMG